MTGPMEISPAQRKRILNIIWFALMAAVGIYWYVHSLRGGRPPNHRMEQFILILAGLSVGAYLGAWIVTRVVLARVAKKLLGAKHNEPPPESPDTLAARLQSTAIISMALFESIVICGLVGSFVGSPFAHTFEWFAIAGGLNLVLYRLQAYPKIFTQLDDLGGLTRAEEDT